MVKINWKKKYIMPIIGICLALTACETEKSSLNQTQAVENTYEEEAEPEDIESGDYSDASAKENAVDEKEQFQEVSEESTNNINVPETVSETKVSEDEIQNAYYERYYRVWDEDEMLAAISERSSYYQQSGYYKEVMYYMENIRGVTDIANVVEPLFYTDMKYYSEENFKDVPKIIINLAKNEIYARHGYIFKSEDLNNYFMGCIWYNPLFSAEEFDTSVFNEYEEANLIVLSELDTK
ncbi:YARHG domain-containing protein [Konateibacter massiliensis]|uniref:YARHG domain-containing protein n=1 Tax=Konateibacter massiliensis TaxID=2002841 RepID=UPI000C15C83F|nr:YARHG domain-containing protein [Konateibacter massiliensis]